MKIEEVMNSSAKNGTSINQNNIYNNETIQKNYKKENLNNISFIRNIENMTINSSNSDINYTSIIENLQKIMIEKFQNLTLENIKNKANNKISNKFSHKLRKKNNKLDLFSLKQSFINTLKKKSDFDIGRI